MTKRHAKDTAKAWGLTTKEVQTIAQWVERRVAPYRRDLVFVKLLRRHYAKQHPPPVPKPKEHTPIQLSLV